MNESPRRNVVEILEERVEILSTLRDLTRRRHDAITNDRADAVARLVEARRPLIERLLGDARGLESAASTAASASTDADSKALRLVDQATALLDSMWDQRVAEQQSWADTGDFGRLERLFAQLESEGILGRMSFMCCNNCA